MASHPSPADISAEKRALRREMAERRASLSTAERRARAQAATARMLALPELASLAGRTVSGYVAVRGELDPAAVLDAARAAGADVALPRVALTTPRLRFHRVDAGAALVPGPSGLLEPDAASPEVPVERIDVMIVPGLAFDADGQRVGFGGGYYDEAGARLRAARTRAVLLGFCYDFQVVARCPTVAADVAVDAVVTERRVLRAGHGQGGDA
jgi:5-formyltetrahydrofolate cyclo-ligase